MRVTIRVTIQVASVKPYIIGKLSELPRVTFIFKIKKISYFLL